ncbi:MAG TPA: glycosyltransferase [Rhizomicrobium sp.]|jgi:hopene-associated glycosyltransferase HpnB|nr:glycosyltransferase [Rhizomicrobium sp.]
MIAGILFGFIPLAIWLYLLLFHNGFWLLRERDTKPVTAPSTWPSVVAVVPARNEADVIQRSIGSLLAQDYPGAFHIMLVDDQSDDGTGPLAQALNADRLTVLRAAPRPSGWTGKLWAMNQGVEQASALQPEFLWFTDADITHAADNLRQLVARAEEGGKVLVSLMARLSCRSYAEHFLIPAFVFFFDMLFPFGAVNNPHSPVAAAAGGCMLARRTGLEKAGGLDAIRGNIIDDCALGRAMKRQGPIWLGLTDRAVSLRPYDHIADIQHMVTRTAYAQLGYSPVVLAATLLGLAMVYLAPVMTALFAWGPSQLAGWVAWIIMAAMYVPMLRFYRLSWLWSPALPLIGVFYAIFTFQSALQHWSGKGGMWKGRAQAKDQEMSGQA